MAENWMSDTVGPILAGATAVVGGVWAVGKALWRSVMARVDAVLEQHHEHVDATNARFSKLDADLNEVRTTSSQFRETMIAAIGDRPTRKEIADQFADMKTFIRDLFATIKTQK